MGQLTKGSIKLIETKSDVEMLDKKDFKTFSLYNSNNSFCR